VDAAFYATRSVLSKMRHRGDVIVYVSSISALQPNASGASYQASKRALHGLAHAVNVEESKNGVRASLVSPELTLRKSPSRTRFTV
jgi:serine 3-dehydrogenase